MTKILLLGVGHFKPSNKDIFGEKIQKQLTKLNDIFVKFNPDKICVEYTAHSQEDIDNSYNMFDLNDFTDIDKMKNQTLGNIKMYNSIYSITYKNEVVQIGYRLGKTLKHDRIYAIDDDTILEDGPWEKISDYYTENNKNCWNKIKYVDDFEDIIKSFLHENSDEVVYCNHHSYMSINSVNTGSTYDGAVYTANWYMRNLKIFANIQKLCETSEKLLIIYGCGHLAILRHLIKSCNNMELVNIIELIQNLI